MAMRMLTALAAALVAVAALPVAVATTSTTVDGVIMVRGNKMYNANSGERFFIKGVRVLW
jgi:hypothetical protein